MVSKARWSCGYRSHGYRSHGYSGNRHLRNAVLLVLPILLCVAGCGEEDDGRVGASGEVTVNGRPVEEGRVSLIPEGDTKGAASGAQIVNGQFTIAPERGLLPGKYRAQVVVNDSGKPEQSASRPPSKREVLSGSREVTLQTPGFQDDDGSDEEDAEEVSIPEFHVEVTSEGPNQFTFQVGEPSAGNE